jgi:hypothetical protein
MRNGGRNRVVRLDEAGLRRLVRGILREAVTRSDLTGLMEKIENFVNEYNDSYPDELSNVLYYGGVGIKDALEEIARKHKLLGGGFHIHDVRCYSAESSDLKVDDLMKKGSPQSKLIIVSHSEDPMENDPLVDFVERYLLKI